MLRIVRRLPKMIIDNCIKFLETTKQEIVSGYMPILRDVLIQMQIADVIIKQCSILYSKIDNDKLINNL